MLNMGKRKSMGTEDISRSMVYLKTTMYCDYNSQTVCDLLNEPHYTIQNFVPNQNTFITKFYSGDISGTDKEIRDKYEYLATRIKDTRGNLIAISKELSIP